MPDLLLELRSEEIPARMQRKAAGDLRRLVTDALVEAGLTYEGAREYWTPRRLTLDIRGLDARSKDTREERKGPSLNAPQAAVHGFLKSVGIEPQGFSHYDTLRVGESASRGNGDVEVRDDGKGGGVFFAVATKPGRSAEEIVAAIMPPIVRAFPWPKSMRWGPASARPGSLRWVRPLQSILCVFGPEVGESVVVDFEVDGIRSGNRTVGHRFHAPEDFIVRRFDDYAAKLEAAHVVLDAERRKEIIRADAGNLAFAQGLEVVEDEGLLEEVANLVEWPVVLMGEFEEAFLAIPSEMIRLTIRANQKCFVLRRAGEEGLADRFILVSNIEASDGGAEIARGNGKVVRARLSDALYFWKTDQGDLPDPEALRPAAESLGLDLAKPLDQRMAKLDQLGVTFHAKLGTQGERVRRIAALAETIAPLVGADPAEARRASLLAKADLTTEAVGEFPELQGLMGRKYATLQGETESVQAAIEDHHKPLGPGDRAPADPVALAVALADKLDTLAGFWAIDEKPTGSKDPYALRRAALGVVRIILENRLNFSIDPLNDVQILRHQTGPARGDKRLDAVLKEAAASGLFSTATRAMVADLERDAPDWLPLVASHDPSIADDLRSFLQDRLKVHLREAGQRHDVIDAVLAPTNCNLFDIVARTEAIGSLLSTEDGRNLLAAYRRAANILAAEEKKGTAIAPAVSADSLVEPEERALLAAIETAEAELEPALGAGDYAAATAALARLRASADAFFEKVLVNADDERLRANRLALLTRIRAATERVADFSRITAA